MNRMNRGTAVAAAALIIAGCGFSARGQSADAIIDKLVDKGILTVEEANELRREADEDFETAQAARADGNEVAFSWKNGLTFQSRDGSTFSGKLGGRIMLDAAAFSADDAVESAVGDVPSGVEFRRVRLATEGKIGGGLPTNYKLEVDFAGAGVSFKDVYLGWSGIPGVGSIKAGHMKEPVGLELITSSRHMTFMERSTATEAFVPERNTGVLLSNSFLDDRATWSVGGFTEVGGSGDNSFDSNARLSGRLTGLAWYDDASGGSRILHLGLSGAYANTDAGTARFRSRPEAHLAPRFADTGSFAADDTVLVGLESALVLGPFSLQGEFFHQEIETPGGADPSFDGYYLQGSYFLTGEHRVYKKSAGAFDRVEPLRPVSLSDGGLGAWEVTVRYSSLDLSDAGILGGELDGVTGGVNWYLNPNMRLMLNYGYANLETPGIDGDAHTIQARAQIDF